ncbi:PhoH family protein [Opitutales bacterium ASA1]|uniref:PhoH family protein n=1 Tax=Congregicoccus parvus TaxID=3081749 RepID=UPI002B2B8A23|nr:PhoH family protein [Opitutales bacterium ASA1]
MASKTLKFPNARTASQLYCGNPANLSAVERTLGVQASARDDWITFDGEEPAVERAETLFNILSEGRAQGLLIKNADFAHMLDGVARGEAEKLRSLFASAVVVQTNRRTIVPKTLGQKQYLQAIATRDIVLGIGPAGTGKTYLAMAAAVSALIKGEVQKLVLTRPAVEAGEALGFLPGDLREKLDPYLRPLYDAMYDMLDREDVAKLAEKGVIEIAPLAYMRGRTLSNAFIILDEAQNTTVEQMMMFLTRLGDGSKMVVTGDITQVDLPRSKTSGLVQARHILADVPGIEIFNFGPGDVVRHPLVLRILEAYAKHQSSKE